MCAVWSRTGKFSGLVVLSSLNPVKTAVRGQEYGLEGRGLGPQRSWGHPKEDGLEWGSGWNIERRDWQGKWEKITYTGTGRTGKYTEASFSVN